MSNLGRDPEDGRIVLTDGGMPDLSVVGERPFVDAIAAHISPSRGTFGGPGRGIGRSLLGW